MLKGKIMFNKTLNRKVFLFWSIFIMILCSMSITLSSDNTFSDSLSISFSVFAGFALFFTAAMLLEEVVHDICNP
jgi:hypothetical protein